MVKKFHKIILKLSKHKYFRLQIRGLHGDENLNTQSSVQSLIGGPQCFGGACHFYLQGRSLQDSALS